MTDGQPLLVELAPQTTVEELGNHQNLAVEALKKGAIIRLNDGRPALVSQIWSREGTSGQGTGQQPPIDRTHIFGGDINAQGRAVGFHYRGEQLHQGKAQVKQILDGPNVFGVYRARVEIYDTKRGEWIQKKALSSFFPDTWSSDRVLLEIYSAFTNQTITRYRYWEGVSSSGIKIAGYLDFEDHIRTAFPFYR